MKHALTPLMLFLSLVALSAVQCSTNIAGGTIETTNGVVTGSIVHGNGLVAPDVEVKLIRETFNPIEEALPDSLIDTTDQNGIFAFTIAVKGTYNIQSVHISKRTRLLYTAIKVNSDTVVLPQDTLKAPGNIMLIMPDTLDTVNGYVYINGTTISKSLSHAVSYEPDYYSLVIDSIPAEAIPSIKYDRTGVPLEPALITDTVSVIPGDTAVTDAFIFWANFSTANSPLPVNRIQNIVFDKDGSLWIGTFRGGVAHYKGSEWTVYDTGNSMLPRDIVSTIFRDTDGRLWIVTQGGIAIIDGSTWSVITTSNSAIPSNALTGYTRDKNGNKWFSSFDGILKYNGSQWTLYDSVNSALPSNEWVHIAVDSSDNIWCSGLNGVSRFNGTTWNTYTTSNSGIYANYAYKIFIDSKKNIWFGHEGAVSKFDGTNWMIYNQTNSSILQNRAFEFYEHFNGDIWIGTHYGLTRYAGGQFIDVTDERYSLLRNKCYYEITADTKNNMWFGTASDGVISFGPTKK